jgi:anti-sigma factor RsiW
MDNQKAKFVLSSYQPALGPQGDEEMRQALEQTERDAELKEWLERQSAFDAEISRALNSVPVPEGLREEILSGGRVTRSVPWWRKPAVGAVAIAAVLTLLTVLGAMIYESSREDGVAGVEPVADDHAMADWQIQALETLNQGFELDWVPADPGKTGSLSAVREYLRQRQLPVPERVLANLDDAQIIGCMGYNGEHRMSQVCFYTKDNQVVHVIARAQPESQRTLPVDATRPRFGGRGNWMTASWADQDADYMLVTRGAGELLREYLYVWRASCPTVISAARTGGRYPGRIGL